ncbi:hypothetical protein CB1_002341002 [Camelus ferus]|nr:hypothetical protein CB1_002341002 [Camelus ferus]
MARCLMQDGGVEAQVEEKTGRSPLPCVAQSQTAAPPHVLFPDVVLLKPRLLTCLKQESHPGIQSSVGEKIRKQVTVASRGKATIQTDDEQANGKLGRVLHTQALAVKKSVQQRRVLFF